MTKMLEILKYEWKSAQFSPSHSPPKNVPRRERPLQGILDVNNVEATDVLLTVRDDTATTPVTATGDEDEVAGIELDEVGDLALLKVETNSVVDLDEGIGVTDGATVVGDDMGDTLATNSDLADLEELVGRLLRSDAVDRETTLDVVKKAEVFVGLVNRNNVHETCRVCLIRADLSIDFDKALFHDLRYFSSIQSVLKPIAEKDGEGKGFPEFMGTR